MKYILIRYLKVLRLLTAENNFGSVFSFFYSRVLKRKKTFVMTLFGEEFSFRTGSPDIETFYEAWNELKFLSGVGLPNGKDFSEGLIIDAGAYAGFTSRFLSRFFPEAVIYAIEPSLDNFDALKSNIDLSPNDNIVAVNKCLTAISGATYTLTKSGSDLSHSITDYEKPGFTKSTESVSSITLGDILDFSGRKRISLLKCDIEGAEYDVFSNINTPIRLVIIELHERKRAGAEKVFNQYSSDRINLVSGEKIISFSQNENEQ